MKIEEYTLFSVPESVLNEELRKNWKLFRSAVIRDIRIIVDRDDFLRDRIKELRFIWEHNTRLPDPIDTFVFRQGEKISKYILVNVPVLIHQVADQFEQELLFKLYKLPGEEKYADKFPVVQRQLRRWTKKLGEVFFVLYPTYHSQLTAAGIQLGLMRNYPKYKEKILDSYLQIVDIGLPIKNPLYRLGDARVETVRKGLPKSSSLFKLGLVKLLAEYGKDYLAHYVAGVPICTMSSVFSLLNAGEMGNELKRRVNDVYKLSNPSVSKRLFEHAKLIDQNTFDECFYPSTMEKENYLSNVERYLGDCVEMKKLMRQLHVRSSLVKPEYSDVVYKRRVFDFLRNTREPKYIS